MKLRLNIWQNIFSFAGLFTYIGLSIFVLLVVPREHQMVILLTTSSLFLMIFILFVGSFWLIKRRRLALVDSFNFFVEKMVATTGVGLVIISADSEVIWASDFIIARFGKSMIGKKVYSLSQEFSNYFSSGRTQFIVSMNGVEYNIQVDLTNRVVLFKDVTTETMLMNQYSSERLILGEVEIDNYQQYQVMLSEEEMFTVQSSVIKMLDNLSERFNMVYRQYVNGKFLIFTTSEVLDVFIENEFRFLDEIRKIQVLEGIDLSVSIGIGGGSSINKELVELSKEGLLQARSRGGDQVCVAFANSKPRYFGSTTEIANTHSRVPVKSIAQFLERRLKAKEIKNVIIYGHKMADLDAVGASLGVAAIAQHYNKDVYIQNQTYDNTATGAIKSFLPKSYQQLQISPAKAMKIMDKESTMVIIVDTADMARIENPKALANIKPENIFVFDHHRIFTLPEKIPKNHTYVDTAASSASEIVTEVYYFLEEAVKPEKAVAQFMLGGIYLDTIRFQKSTTSRTFEAAAYLESMGASSKLAADWLKFSEENSKLIKTILDDIREVKPGFFLASYAGEVPLDVISMAADEMLRTSGRKAAFTIARIPGKKQYKMSARAIDTNVQVIAEEVGGGGHFSAAAAVSDEELKVFVENIEQAIIESKEN